jgi:phosphoglycolate phosphatase
MNYKGVIFDLDGTLANTLDDLSDSMNNVLTGKNYPVHGAESYRTMIGKGIRNLVIEALPEPARTEEIITNCYGLMLADYEENCLVKTRMYDGIAELIRMLKLKDIKLAVLSNKADGLTKRIIENLFTPADFEVIIGAHPGIPAKPDPTGALLISSLLKIEPAGILFLGDTGIDMETANKAGMFAAGVLWGFRQKDELLENGARIIINHPLELLDF